MERDILCNIRVSVVTLGNVSSRDSMSDVEHHSEFQTRGMGGHGQRELHDLLD